MSEARAGPEASILPTIIDENCRIAVWQRSVDATVQAEAATLAAGEPLDLRLSRTPARLGQEIIASMTAACGSLRAMPALLNDIRRIAGHFALIASSLDIPGTVTLRLETLQDDGCRRFHVDRVRLRLLCTYLGPGTEWLTDDQVDRDALAGHQPNESILRRGEPQRLAPFWVAILKGDLYPGAAGNGQVHRSPPVAAAGIRRVLLGLDV